MDEARAQAQRVVYEASGKRHETTHEAAKMLNELADRGAQAAALTEANQRVLNEVLGLGMETAQESARLFLRLQQNTLDMLRESQAAALRCQLVWPEVFKDPLRWYQSVCHESIDGARKAFGVVNGTSEALTESVGR